MAIRAVSCLVDTNLYRLERPFVGYAHLRFPGSTTALVVTSRQRAHVTNDSFRLAQDGTLYRIRDPGFAGGARLSHVVSPVT